MKKKYLLVYMGAKDDLFETIAECLNGKDTLTYISSEKVVLFGITTRKSLNTLYELFYEKLSNEENPFILLPANLDKTRAKIFLTHEMEEHLFQDIDPDDPDLQSIDTIADIPDQEIDELDGAEEEDMIKNLAKSTKPQLPSLNDLLDKIQQVGYEKLSKEEKKLLKKYSSQ